MNSSYIGLLERGERTPSIDVLLKICRAVELAPAELFADANPQPTKDEPEITQLRTILASWPAKHRKALLKVAREIEKIRER